MPASRPHSVAMVAFLDAQILDVVGPLEVFSRAARLLTDDTRAIRASGGMKIVPDYDFITARVPK